MRKETSIPALLVLTTIVIAPLLMLFAATPANASATTRSHWSAEELRILATLRLSGLRPAPRDPSNSVEADPAAIALGKRLFNDPRFSRNEAVSCATCHDPGKQFQDGLPVGKGVGIGSRRSMPIVGLAYSPWLFWDGRKDSAWSQALGPLEDAVEHGGNRSRYAHLLSTHYRVEYEAIFGAMPDLSMVPKNAGPGGSASEQAAWNALGPKRQQDVSRIFANMGKAIAAYEKTLSHGESRFDKFAESLISGKPLSPPALSPQEQNGLRLFIGKGQCATCHNGPLFSDQQFHNTGVPQRESAKPDHGRLSAIAKVKADEFNCLGAYSDAKPEQCQELRFIVSESPALDAAFKTPSLRGVAQRAPYMHAGQIRTLEDVLAHYIAAPKEVADLIAFLGALSAPVVEGAKK